MKQPSEWTCTNKDTLQFSKKINDKVFSFKEFKPRLFNPMVVDTTLYIEEREKLNHKLFIDKYWDNNKVWNRAVINLNEYSTESIKLILEKKDLEYDGEYITEQSGEFFKDDLRVAKLIFQHITQ